MTRIIFSVRHLEDCVGAPAAPIKMKIIDHLDASAAKWIASSPLAFVGLGSADGPRVCVAGGLPGFATVRDAQLLSLPLSALDAPGRLEVGLGAGVLFLVPVLGETLRANGRITAVSDAAVEIAIEECFVHCAKALIRSNFWAGGAGPVPDEPVAFVAATRFLALATMDAKGRVDISPKGDPAGLLIRMSGAHATLAERPGNRLAFGYRNIIEQPQVAVLGLIPGARSVVLLHGRAHLTTDEGVRQAFAVEGKTPILATVIEGVRARVHVSAALERAALWKGTPAATSDIDPAATLVAHLKLNKARGVQATLLRLAANRGLVAKGLENNYKAQLY
jgi:predicted pyridoxine 5'-phosphate oxidase superfamily flavin-nucleotide-binding protein